MRELALARSERALGCTQASEILATPGVELVGALPDGFGLATLYCAALRSGTPQPGLATRLLQRLTGEESRGLRQQCGFLAI
jgi:molybdate transport system substrate-binding protein